MILTYFLYSPGTLIRSAAATAAVFRGLDRLEGR